MADDAAADAELLLDLGDVEADLPAHALGAARQQAAPVVEVRPRAREHPLVGLGGGGHGSITIFSASRRSYRA